VTLFRSRFYSKECPMLLKAPAGVTAVNIGGAEIAVKDGLVEVPASAAATLYAHGFTPAEAQGADPARAVMPDPATMTRRAMLDWLAARGVATDRPIRTAALRALVREQMAKGD
jgi:hypothetical protein